MLLNLTWVDLAFSDTKGYPGQVKRHSLPFQEEAVLKYLVVPLTFGLDCTYTGITSKLHLKFCNQKSVCAPDSFIFIIIGWRHRASVSG